MNSKIYTGRLWHKRLSPKEHEFDYPAYFYLFDLGELEELDQKHAFFAYNRFQLVSIHDKDYLKRGAESIRTKVLNLLSDHGFQNRVRRIELVTCARFMGYVFNPVSFYFCYNEKGYVECTIAEVRNTFGEMHLYLLKDEFPRSFSEEIRYSTDKVFHVSPFFDRSGEYDFRFSKSKDFLDIQINLKKEGKPVLLSRLSGQPISLTNSHLFRTTLRYPLTAIMTIPRIHWNAMKLYFKKKLPIYRKPPPMSSMTIRKVTPSRFQRRCRDLIFKYLSKIRVGSLRLILPDGTTREFGDSRSSDQALLRVQHYDFFWRLIRDAGIGLGEGYMREDWDSPDVTSLLRLLIKNKSYFSKKVSFWNILGDKFNRWRHLRRDNTLHGSKKNIEEHYDLSNDFYQLFLDESMTYSCGYFKSERDTLQDAQENKLQMMLEKASIGPQDEVLEIGCGWGSLALKGVREKNCKWTGITLSKEQLALARTRVLEAGFADRIDLKLCDYRKVEGQYDRIVSVEMLEAVGHEYLGKFFESCERLLKPDGIIVLQVITIPDQRYASYHRGCDWIQKHIFPGGHLPSLSVLSEVLTKHTDFFIEDLENIGVHYAKTLCMWRENFRGQAQRVKEIGFSDEFMRKWSYYLSYCEAAFAERYLNDLQIVLTRVGNRNLNRKQERPYVAY